MKKLLAILAICLLPGVGWGASYYGCGAGAINGDATWCAVGDVTNGVCAKDSGDYVAGATALAGTHTLYANGCTITIPSGTFTAAKLSTKGDGSKGAGGGFTANANDITVTLDANIEGGTTDCLTASNTAGTASVINILTTNGGGTITTDATADADGVSIVGTKVTVNIGKSGSPVAITGGGAANKAVNDSSTLTTKTVFANILGGTVTSAIGYSISGATGNTAITGNVEGGTAGSTIGLNITAAATATVNGNCKGGAGAGTTTSSSVGCQTSSGAMTVTGDCTADETSLAQGCMSNGGAITTVNGNLNGSNRQMAAAGTIIWNPSAASNYFKQTYNGAEYYYYSKAPAAANVAVGTSVVDSTDGSFDAGTKAGGGAWAN